MHPTNEIVRIPFCQKITPSIILKVMAGDTIQAAVRAYYKQQATPKKKITIPAEQMLAGLLQALVAPQTQAVSMHNARLAPAARTMSSGLTANDLRSLRQKKPDRKKVKKPKAYLNYVFFDKQLNFVKEGSGVKQVDGEAGELETLSSGKVVAKKNGYVYVFTSNESKQDVFFDNLGVGHYRASIGRNALLPLWTDNGWNKYYSAVGVGK